ncbi:hypothetical protein KSS87_003903 [Heliosperma pusillum]|nr:hypothetical protein KSS87_003903 [Heliosperma pusillum]
MDSLMVCKTITALPTPGLWMNQKNEFKKGPSSLLVGSRVNFPRQTARVLKINRTSRKAGGALAVTCQADKILVANRGEIAVRVIRTAHEMGIPCVAVYSTIDKDALHVKIADEAVCIGEAPSNQSYLVIPNVLSAAVSRGCTMLHPGYGFLSENAAFVEMCKEHGINFIGPNPDSIRVMGDKSTARDTMKKAGVPTVPGSDGLLQSTDEAIKLAHEIGFPVMIKATAGGGGRGMRLAKEPDEFVKLLQVLADKFGNVVHFGERDCSIQLKFNPTHCNQLTPPGQPPQHLKVHANIHSHQSHHPNSQYLRQNTQSAPPSPPATTQHAHHALLNSVSDTSKPQAVLIPRGRDWRGRRSWVGTVKIRNEGGWTWEGHATGRCGPALREVWNRRGGGVEEREVLGRRKSGIWEGERRCPPCTTQPPPSSNGHCAPPSPTVPSPVPPCTSVPSLPTAGRSKPTISKPAPPVTIDPQTACHAHYHPDPRHPNPTLLPHPCSPPSLADFPNYAFVSIKIPCKIGTVSVSYRGELCWTQETRRNQKLLEEAPSPALTPELRKAMGDAAVSAAASIGYIGVGTVEFLLDERGSFYFMEMNTRIQVEHPVTEMISSTDLIEEQIRVAMGEKLRYKQEDIVLKGHSIECRINAEDAFKGFRPGPGKITTYLPSGGPFVRMDSHVYPGYVVPPSYDSLLGKLIVWAPTREKAIARMKRALEDTIITGVPTTIEYHKLILDVEDFKNGKVDTAFIPKHEQELAEPQHVVRATPDK